MRRVESNLLNLREVILRVLVQDELSDLTQLELILWPDVCQVEHIDLLLLPQLLGLLGSHGLNADVPAWIFTLLDSLVQVLRRIVRRVVGRIFLGNEAGALLRFEVKLHIHPFSLGIDQLESMATVAVHLAVTIWNTAVAKQNHELVNGFRVLRCIVPEICRIIGVSQMSRRIAFLGVDLEMMLADERLRSLQSLQMRELTKWGNLAGSRRKKTGVLLATISRLPSLVKNFTENPRGSRAQSCEPDSPPTVENRAVTGQALPCLKISAKQRSSRESVVV